MFAFRNTLRFYLSLILVCSFIFETSGHTQQNDIETPSILNGTSAEYRLPTSIFPTRYHLRLLVILDPYPPYEQFTAPSYVTINITCVENTSQIYLHAVNLTISHETVQVSDSHEVSLGVKNLTYDEINDFFIISLDKSLQLQQGEKYAISMYYVAQIPDYRLNGMYQDFYQDPATSETRYIATTLFAPYHARRLFPSFDEPSFRAEYDVEIAHHVKYHAMANGDLIDSFPMFEQSDYVVDVFQTTPSISSYITAMIVSDFTYEQASDDRFSNRTVRIYAAPHLISLGAAEYAANITDSVMGFLENRFQVKYPLGKLYSIALPHFFFSAMENIGMITYKEPVLLYLKNETTEEERYTINSVMSHELSHQWFGNIVACKFWSWVWLKEGFATFYAQYGMNHTNPELKPWEMFIPKVLTVAMNFDSSNATHPLENIPPTSAAVADIYTSIPYQKGASINRMTSTFLTEDVFEQAMKLYINKHEYSSADQYDLFDCLQEAVNKNSLISSLMPTSVRDIMSSWTLQSVFPIITVNRTDSSHIQLTQERYSEEETSNEPTTWWVPINLQPRSKPDLPGTVPDAWIPQGQTSISVEVVTGEPVIVNPDAIDYYRVQYDDPTRLEIMELLLNNHNVIPAAGRSKLIDDYYNFVWAGYSSLEYAMDLTKYIQNDTNYAVWLTFQNTMDDLIKQLTFIDDTVTVDLLKEYLIRKVKIIWGAVERAMNGHSESKLGSTAMLYELLIRWSCELGACVAFIDDEITKFMNLPQHFEIPKEQQLAFYCLASGQEDRGSDVWDYLLNEFSNPATLFGKKQRLLKALACTKDLNKLKWLIKEAFNRDSPYFSLSDSGQLLQVLAKKRHASELLLEHIVENSEVFFDRYDNHVENILLDIAEIMTNMRKKQVMNLVEQLQYAHPERVERIHALLTRSERRRALLSKSLASKLRVWLNTNNNEN